MSKYFIQLHVFIFWTAYLAVGSDKPVFEPRPFGMKELSDGTRVEVARKLVAPTPTNSSSQPPKKYAELVVQCFPPNLSGRPAVSWTNQAPLSSSSPDLLNDSYSVLDVTRFHDQLFVSYNSGPSIYVEEILPPEANRPRERLLLTRGFFPDFAWTTVAFTTNSNSLSLVSAGKGGEMLVWEWTNKIWSLNWNRSQPNGAREAAYSSWALLEWQVDRWRLKQKLPERPRHQASRKIGFSIAVTNPIVELGSNVLISCRITNGTSSTLVIQQLLTAPIETSVWLHGDYSRAVQLTSLVNSGFDGGLVMIQPGKSHEWQIWAEASKTIPASDYDAAAYVRARLQYDDGTVAPLELESNRVALRIK